MATWTPDSWRDATGIHMPVYKDAAALAATEHTLRNYPPLVFAGEARNLTADLAKVADGKAFLLQGGRRLEHAPEEPRVEGLQDPGFLQAAAAHKLAYLGEADPSTMAVDNLPASTAQALRSGVVTVHQNINDGVVPGLDVASNLLLDSLAEGGSLNDPASFVKRLNEMLLAGGKWRKQVRPQMRLDELLARAEKAHALRQTDAVEAMVAACERLLEQKERT